MHSLLEYSCPKEITDNSNFGDIFLGVINKHLERNDCIYTSHASIVPDAIDFFRENVSEDRNPASLLEKSFGTRSPFIPGTSLISVPMAQKLGYINSDSHNVDNEWSRADSTELGLKIGGIDISLSRTDWERVFGQIPSAALIVAKEREFDTTIRIPSFNNRFPNYFYGLRLNYMPEGLRIGTVHIADSAGDYCGKFSRGGRVIVNGSVGENFGDCSNNVEYFVKEFAGEPTQVNDCDFYLGHKIQTGRYGFEALSEGKIEKLRNKGCNVYENASFEKFPNLLKNTRNVANNLK